MQELRWETVRDDKVVAPGAGDLAVGTLIATANKNQTRNDFGELIWPHRLYIVLFDTIHDCKVTEEIGWLTAKHLIGNEVDELGGALRQFAMGAPQPLNLGPQ